MWLARLTRFKIEDGLRLAKPFVEHPGMTIIGIGTDIVECLRIGQMIERHGELFLTRVFTPIEIEYCTSRKASIQHYAGRWAAKEAVLKAIGTGWAKGISWQDIEVRNELGGRPHLHITGGALDACRRLGIDDIQISISHCRSHAVAFATATGPSNNSGRRTPE